MWFVIWLRYGSVKVKNRNQSYHTAFAFLPYTIASVRNGRLANGLRIDRNSQVCSEMSQAAERNIHLGRSQYNLARVLVAQKRAKILFNFRDFTFSQGETLRERVLPSAHKKGERGLKFVLNREDTKDAKRSLFFYLHLDRASPIANIQFAKMIVET